MRLRPFTPEDVPALAQYQFPGLSDAEIICTLAQWQTKTHNGCYFEILAAEENGTVVGYVSLYESVPGVASEGVEVYPPYRHQGFGFAAVTALLHRAAALGYTTITARVRQDNVASLSLHEKLGFQIRKSDISTRGQPVYELFKSMEVISHGL